MKALLKTFFILALTMLLLAPAKDCRAQSLDLSGFVVETRQGGLVVIFSLDVQGFDKIKAVLDNGSRLVLVCNVSLLKARLIFRDRPIANRVMEIGLEKDLLSGQYSIIFPGRRLNQGSFDEKDFVDHFSEMSLEIHPLDNLNPDQKYIARIEVELISKEVPEWIKRILFFWNWDLVKPIRYEMDFAL